MKRKMSHAPTQDSSRVTTTQCTMENLSVDQTETNEHTPMGLDVYAFLINTAEYAEEQEELAAFRALRSVSPALEAIVRKTEEALKCQVFLIKHFLLSHESKMRRLERKIEKGFARLESRIRDLESSDLNSSRTHSPPPDRSAFSSSESLPETSSEEN